MNIGNAMMNFGVARNNWQIHNTRMAKAIERISSGSKINRAADDVAGMGISEKMRADLTMMSRMQTNYADYMSELEISDTKLSGMQDILLRLQDLATQSANGTYSNEDRALMDKEYQALLDEYSSIGKTAMPKLDDLANLKGVQTGIGDFTVKGGNIYAFLDAVDSFTGEINQAAIEGNEERLNELLGEDTKHLSNSQRLQLAVVKFVKENGTNLLNTPDSISFNTSVSFKNGEMKLSFGDMSADSSGLEGTNIKTKDDALKAMDSLKEASKSLASSRGDVGAMYNRYDRSLNRLKTMEENLTASLARITDTDIAKEMMEYTKAQVLAQASSFVMSMCRTQAQDILTLLKQ